MASIVKRSWKFQDFMAHKANVNCLALGHKSGRVMVTGGDDKKVNLWAVGKQSCFMSLSGHTTPVDCVQFNQLEELVCAGSRAGTLKVWDLEAAKLVRTLNGHKYAIKCIDFSPYGDSLVSGSADSSIKIWDTRKKGAIYTYNGHKGTVNSVKFSPDGQWIATGGEDSIVKIWDVRVGRVLKDFQDHSNPVTCVEFHPREFLLASGSMDRSVHFFDLENFNLVSSESEVGAVRCLCFNPDGECLFAGTRDYLKIVGWEPNRLFDSVPMYWGRVSDISTASNQLIGASFHLTNVQVYVVDLKKCRPFSGTSISTSVTTATMGPPIIGPTPPVMAACPSPFATNQSVRRSFTKADRSSLLLRDQHRPEVRTIEESTSGTDPEEENAADITNFTDYNEIFKGRGLQRTPPPVPFQEPERDDIVDPAKPQILSNIISDNVEALSLDNDINNYKNHHTSPPNNQYSRSKSNLDQVYHSKLSKQHPPIKEPLPVSDNNSKNAGTRGRGGFRLQRQSSCKEVPEKQATRANIRHSISEANINKGNSGGRNSSVSGTATRKNSFSLRNEVPPTRNASVPNVSRLPPSSRAVPMKAPPPPPARVPSVELYLTKTSAEKEDEEDDKEGRFIPLSVDRPVGLDLDDFLPKNHTTSGFQQQLADLSESEVLGVILRGHEPTKEILKGRLRCLKIVIAQFRSKDLRTAVDTAIALDDSAVLVDILGVINSKYSLWNLDLCVAVLPKLLDLIQSKYETYITAACDTLKLVLKHFGHVIRDSIQCPVGSFGVDIPREERYQKAVKCHEMLSQIRSFIVKKQSLPSVGSSFKEVHDMMCNFLD